MSSTSSSSMLGKRSHDEVMDGENKVADFNNNDRRGKKARAWVGTPPKEYIGNSRYGPCTFYYFPDTYMWVVRCRNKHRKKKHYLPIVVAHPTMKDIIEDADVMQALGNPQPLPFSRVNVPPGQPPIGGVDFMAFEDKLRTPLRRVVMKAHAQMYFQSAGFPERDHDMLHNWCKPDVFGQDGDYIWAAWRDMERFYADYMWMPQDLMKHVMQPMLFPFECSGGYTGYFATDIKARTHNGYLRVDCRHNPAFWAELHHNDIVREDSENDDDDFDSDEL